MYGLEHAHTISPSKQNLATQLLTINTATVGFSATRLVRENCHCNAYLLVGNRTCSLLCEANRQPTDQNAGSSLEFPLKQELVMRTQEEWENATIIKREFTKLRTTNLRSKLALLVRVVLIKRRMRSTPAVNRTRRTGLHPNTGNHKAIDQSKGRDNAHVQA